jgi:tetratricopeptide (TPR) repeat protein
VVKEANLKNSEGIRLFNTSKYKEAIQIFQQAIDLFPKDQRNQWLYYDITMNLANSYQMDGQYAKAKVLYEQLLQQDSGRSSQYQIELDNLMLRIKDREVLNELTGKSPKNNSPVEVSGDEKLVSLIKEILPNFSGIRLPITVKFIEAKDNNKKYIRELGSTGEYIPISQSSRRTRGHLLIYNNEFWRDANDSELRGNLAHELMHREWEDTGLEKQFFIWSANSLNYLCLEWIIDLCVLAKGFVEDLYNSKKYIYDHEHDKDNYLKNDISMNLNHLYNILGRAEIFVMPGREDNIPKYMIPKDIQKDFSK